MGCFGCFCVTVTNVTATSASVTSTDMVCTGLHCSAEGEREGQMNMARPETTAAMTLLIEGKLAAEQGVQKKVHINTNPNFQP